MRFYAARESMAEEVGFEPTVPCGTTVFKTAAFDHSATPPNSLVITNLPAVKTKSSLLDTKAGLLTPSVIDRTPDAL